VPRERHATSKGDPTGVSQPLPEVISSKFCITLALSYALAFCLTFLNSCFFNLWLRNRPVARTSFRIAMCLLYNFLALLTQKLLAFILFLRFMFALTNGLFTFRQRWTESELKFYISKRVDFWSRILN
jgi:hypothetical protein